METVITMRVVMNNMRVMSNNMRAVFKPVVVPLTVSVGNMLTLLNIGDVYNNLTLFMFFSLRYLVALVFNLFITVRTRQVTNMARLSLTLGRRDSARHKTGGQEKNYYNLHLGF